VRKRRKRGRARVRTRGKGREQEEDFPTGADMGGSFSWMEEGFGDPESGHLTPSSTPVQASASFGVPQSRM
jgi:hypothetical protein